MAQEVTAQVDRRDLVETTVLRELVDEIITEERGLFSVSGSLLDYRIDDDAMVLRAKRSGEEIEVDTRFDWPEQFDGSNYEREKRRVRDSLLRSGVARPANVAHVMARLRQTDDVVIGLDTNILIDCVFTSHLLDEIYKERFPNWILIAIPKLVMAEIENRANAKIGGGDHPRVGWPGYRGRIGNRALQEIMDLDTKTPDRPGMSIMTVGELGLDAAEYAKHENWLLDSEIRTQFQEFLNEISFHKGTYFLSQDRVNVMMSGTEGADGLYLQKPEPDELATAALSTAGFADLLYELCIQFGEIELSCLGDADASLRLGIFWPGKHVEDWRKSRMRIENVEVPPW